MRIEFNGSMADILSEMEAFMNGLKGNGPTEKRVVKQPTEKASEPVQVEAAVPVEPVEVTPIVPVTSTSYNIADLQKMAGDFVKKGAANRDKLINILASMNVKAITHLEESQYGMFVQKLKEAGADV